MSMKEDQDFRAELSRLLNSHSREARSDTPDFILALYLKRCLDAFDAAVAHREQWHGRSETGEPNPL
jgi:hypothetical protein